MGVKDRLRPLVPPIALSAARRLRAPEPGVWRYCPEGWEGASVGWSASSVVDHYEAEWEHLIHEADPPRPLSPDHLALGYVLSRIAEQDSSLSVLDWGGAFGHYLHCAEAMRPDLSFDWTVRDLPSLCETGRRLNPRAQFVDSDTELPDRRFDLVFLSGIVQFVEDWRQTLNQARTVGRWCFLTRLPTTEAPSFVVEQTAYDSTFRGWVLNDGEVLTEVGTVERRFDGIAEALPGAPAPLRYRGYLIPSGSAVERA